MIWCYDMIPGTCSKSYGCCCYHATQGSMSILLPGRLYFSRLCLHMYHQKVYADGDLVGRAAPAVPGSCTSSVPMRTAVVLTLTHIIKSVVTGQAPVTLELRNTPGKKHKPKVVHAYFTADAVLASTRNISKVKSGVSLRCARSILAHTSHYSRLEKPTNRYTACHPRAVSYTDQVPVIYRHQVPVYGNIALIRRYPNAAVPGHGHLHVYQVLMRIVPPHSIPQRVYLV